MDLTIDQLIAELTLEEKISMLAGWICGTRKR